MTAAAIAKPPMNMTSRFWPASPPSSALFAIRLSFWLLACVWYLLASAVASITAFCAACTRFCASNSSAFASSTASCAALESESGSPVGA
jgi:hypothetical protein